MRILLTLLFAFVPRMAAADKTAAVALGVTIAERTSLHVSTDLLTFVVPQGGTSATAVVAFTAAARALRDADIFLSVQPGAAIDAPRGTCGDLAITFTGDGPGTQSGVLTSGVAAAGRWQGSGQHTGRLIFTLHASAPGVYAVPIKFAVTTRQAPNAGATSGLNLRETPCGSPAVSRGARER